MTAMVCPDTDDPGCRTWSWTCDDCGTVSVGHRTSRVALADSEDHECPADPLGGRASRPLRGAAVMALAPPFVYYGGKTVHAQRIAALLPAHRHYVEPFAGSLAVLLAKRPSAMETVNDLDGRLMCVAPGTRVLTADYRWVPAGDVHVGDRLIGFDEYNATDKQLGRRVPTSYRRWRGAEVEAVTTARKPCYRLAFDDGTEVTASADHAWLCSGPPGQSRGARWQRTERLICDRAAQRSWVVKLLDVVEREHTWDAGWLAGFYDGEGNIVSSGANSTVPVTQKLGPEADLCEQMLMARGFDVRQHVAERVAPRQTVVSLVLGGGKPEVLRFLSLMGPQRLIRNFNTRFLENSSLYGHKPVGLVSKEYVGEQDVMAIQTSTRTYVAEGLASHNCFWRVLRDRPADLITACALTPHSRAEFTASRDLEADDELEVARRVWAVLSQSRGGTLRRTGWRFFRDPAKSSFGMSDYLAAYVARMPAAARRLIGVSLECRPALDVIRDYGQQDGVLIYADPPYLGSTRHAGYSHELRTDEQHRELADALLGCRASVVLSGYPSALYDDMYAGWHRREFAAWTGNGIRGDKTRIDGNRVEVLWSNRPLLGALDLFSGAVS